MRYFWRGTPSDGLKEWFLHGPWQRFPAGGGEERLDLYFRIAGQVEFGLKRRGHSPGIEVKGLIAHSEKQLQSPFAGPIEIWGKWALPLNDLGDITTLAVTKKRWLRKFDTGIETPIEIALGVSEEPIDERQLPTEGCNVELTKLQLSNSEVWWSFGFEAFGTLTTVERNLMVGAETLAARYPPTLLPDLIASYPAWISRYILA